MIKRFNNKLIIVIDSVSIIHQFIRKNSLLKFKKIFPIS